MIVAPKISEGFKRDLRMFDPCLGLVWSEDLKANAGDPNLLSGMAAMRARIIERECARPHWIVFREVTGAERLRMVQMGVIEPGQRFVFVLHWQGSEDTQGQIRLEVNGGYLPLDDRLIERLALGDPRGRWRSVRSFAQFKQMRDETNLQEALSRRYSDEEFAGEAAEEVLTEATRRPKNVREKDTETGNAGNGNSQGTEDTGNGDFESSTGTEG